MQGLTYMLKDLTNDPPFFYVWVSFPNADTCKDLEPSNIYKLHGVKKKGKYAERVNEMEHRTFSPRSITAGSLS